MTFSEPVSGIDAADLLVNGRPPERYRIGATTFSHSHSRHTARCSHLGGQPVSQKGLPANALTARGP